jgi:hypothetical protein
MWRGSIFVPVPSPHTASRATHAINLQETTWRWAARPAQQIKKLSRNYRTLGCESDEAALSVSEQDGHGLCQHCSSLEKAESSLFRQAYRGSLSSVTLRLRAQGERTGCGLGRKKNQIVGKDYTWVRAFRSTKRSQNVERGKDRFHWAGNGSHAEKQGGKAYVATILGVQNLRMSQTANFQWSFLHPLLFFLESEKNIAS